MKRELGSLTSADLGVQIQGTPSQRTTGAPKPTGPITGYLESVHHFRVGDESYTAAIVKVHRTAKQVRDREPDHREIRGTADGECEVTERA